MTSATEPQRKWGAIASGAGLRSASYGANQLNQITNRTVPTAVDILGAAKATASVTVNSVPATTRKSEYFHKEVSAANVGAPTNASITVTATEGPNNPSESGTLLVPPATQTFSYDQDGNLTNDSVWSYLWDAENRLIQMTNLTTVTSTARKKLVFSYDGMGRRLTKKVYPWSGSSYSSAPETDHKFLYHGWNLLAELNATNNAAIRSYMWGQDLSGTIQGVAGIGGLLMLTTPSTNHVFAYNGNGNVIATVDAGNHAVSSRYEHGPFAEEIRQSGSAAKVNPFRFSTKFSDEESGLMYYGYRYYSVSLGRSISKDPVEENGGLNLYALFLNSPVQKIDTLGDSTIETSDGYSLRLDPHTTGGQAHFEIHVYYKGNEEGIFTRQGFINKHGLSGALSAANIPEHIRHKINGMAVDFERRAGRIGPKGTQNIKNGGWMAGGAHLNLGSTLMTLGAILKVVEGDLLAGNLASATVNYLHLKASDANQGDIDLAAIEVGMAVQDIFEDGFLTYTIIGGLLE